jgi:hypothetical protein
MDQALLPHQHASGARGLDDLFKGFLPRATRNELLFVQPGFDAAFCQCSHQLTHRWLVLAVMAEKYIELFHCYHLCQMVAFAADCWGQT